MFYFFSITLSLLQMKRSAATANAAQMFIRRALKEISKQAKRNNDELKDACSVVLSELDHDDGTTNADKYFFPFKLACYSGISKLQITSLNCIHQLFVYAILKGDTVVDANGTLMIEEIVNVVIFCSQNSDYEVSLQVLKIVTIMLASEWLYIPDKSITQCLSCVFGLLLSSNPSVRQTADATIQHVCSTFFMGAGNSEYRLHHAKLAWRHVCNIISYIPEQTPPQNNDDIGQGIVLDKNDITLKVFMLELIQNLLSFEFPAFTELFNDYLYSSLLTIVWSNQLDILQNVFNIVYDLVYKELVEPSFLMNFFVNYLLPIILHDCLPHELQFLCLEFIEVLSKNTKFIALCFVKLDMDILHDNLLNFIMRTLQIVISSKFQNKKTRVKASELLLSIIAAVPQFENEKFSASVSCFREDVEEPINLNRLKDRKEHLQQIQLLFATEKKQFWYELCVFMGCDEEMCDRFRKGISKIDTETAEVFCEIFFKDFWPEYGFLLPRVALGGVVGGYKDFNIVFSRMFIANLNFKGRSFLESLRLLMGSCVVPGESQVINRVLEMFSKCYFEANPELETGAFLGVDPELLDEYEQEAQPFITPPQEPKEGEEVEEKEEVIGIGLTGFSTLHCLAYSVVLLNTDLHNPNNRRRMPKQIFVANYLRNPEFYVDPRFLLHLYDDIKRTEFTANINDSLPEGTTYAGFSGVTSRKFIVILNGALNTENYLNDLHHNRGNKLYNFCHDFHTLATKPVRLMGLKENRYSTCEITFDSTFFAQHCLQGIGETILYILRQSNSSETINIAEDIMKVVFSLWKKAGFETHFNIIIERLVQNTTLGVIGTNGKFTLQESIIAKLIMYVAKNYFQYIDLEGWANILLVVSECDRRNVSFINGGQRDYIYSLPFEHTEIDFLDFFKAITQVSVREMQYALSEDVYRMYSENWLVNVYEMAIRNSSFSDELKHDSWRILSSHIVELSLSSHKNCAFLGANTLRQALNRRFQYGSDENLGDDMLRCLEAIVSNVRSSTLCDLILSMLQELIMKFGSKCAPTLPAMLNTVHILYTRQQRLRSTSFSPMKHTHRERDDDSEEDDGEEQLIPHSLDFCEFLLEEGTSDSLNLFKLKDVVSQLSSFLIDVIFTFPQHQDRTNSILTNLTSSMVTYTNSSDCDVKFVDELCGALLTHIAAVIPTVHDQVKAMLLKISEDMLLNAPMSISTKLKLGKMLIMPSIDELFTQETENSTLPLFFRVFFRLSLSDEKLMCLFDTFLNRTDVFITLHPTLVQQVLSVFDETFENTEDSLLIKKAVDFFSVVFECITNEMDHLLELDNKKHNLPENIARIVHSFNTLFFVSEQNEQFLYDKLSKSGERIKQLSFLKLVERLKDLCVKCSEFVSAVLHKRSKYSGSPSVFELEYVMYTCVLNLCSFEFLRDMYIDPCVDLFCEIANNLFTRFTEVFVPSIDTPPSVIASLKQSTLKVLPPCIRSILRIIFSLTGVPNERSNIILRNTYENMINLLKTPVGTVLEDLRSILIHRIPQFLSFYEKTPNE
ncbi:hypothetical protein PCE1_000694 [Barthelona sp. PCE]